MKKIILTVGLVLGVMLINDINAQDRDTEASDHPAVENGGVNPETGVVNTPDNQQDESETNTVVDPAEDNREKLQDNAEVIQNDREETPGNPATEADSVNQAPTGSPSNPAGNTGQIDNEVENGAVGRDTASTPEDVTDANRGIGTNSSDSNVNYRTGMPSNTTTPEQLNEQKE